MWLLQCINKDYNVHVDTVLRNEHFTSIGFSRLPQRGSVGEKFFDYGASLALMKKMKKRLQETSELYDRLASKIEEDAPMTG